MAETLGSLCDKLTVLKLKQWHCDEPGKARSLSEQVANLTQEIDELVLDAREGRIDPARLCYAANKVYKQAGNEIAKVVGTLGAVFAQLAHANCALWHEQEKVYEFERVPVAEKDRVVKQLALLNLQRNACIDALDRTFMAHLSAESVR